MSDGLPVSPSPKALLPVFTVGGSGRRGAGGRLYGALDRWGGVLMSHVDFKKHWPNVALSTLSCRPVEFKQLLCPMSLSFKSPCRMSQSPKKGHVAVSILGV